MTQYNRHEQTDSWRPRPLSHTQSGRVQKRGVGHPRAFTIPCKRGDACQYFQCSFQHCGFDVLSNVETGPRLTLLEQRGTFGRTTGSRRFRPRLSSLSRNAKTAKARSVRTNGRRSKRKRRSRPRRCCKCPRSDRESNRSFKSSVRCTLPSSTSRRSLPTQR
jgi:hypothetical protein